MNASDLLPFCNADEYRPKFRQPFSVGEFTYATDRRLLVRVPRLPDVPEDPAVDSDAIDRVTSIAGRPPMKTDDLMLWEPVPDFPREPFKAVCEDCYEAGRVLDACKPCGGTGVVTEHSFGCDAVRIGNRHLGPRLLFTLSKLPALEFSAEVGEEMDAIYFRFEGGCGVLMPLRISDPSRSKVFPPE